MRKLAHAGALLGLLCVAGLVQAQTLNTVRVATGLARPVFVTTPPGDFNRIFVVEQRSGTIGRIRIVRITDPNAPVLLPTPFLSINPVATGNEEGLLGLAFHPDYFSNGFFFVYYTNSSGNNLVYRYRAQGDPLTSDLADPASATLVLTLNHPTNSNHNGGWISFGPDGYLYIGTGDGGSANDPPGNAQNVNALLGKMLRLDIDVDDPNIPGFYSCPSDNPYFGPTTGRDEIWAIGLRNPWRNDFDNLTGDLWIADVGQNAVEEIDFQPASDNGGRNYGWRCMEGTSCTGLSGCTCNGPTLILPIHTFTHSAGNCSVTGGPIYRGTAMCSLRGTYFFADYCSNQIWSLRYAPGVGVTEFTSRTADLDPAGADTITSITGFGEDAFGEIYICEQAGDIWKIVPQPALAAAGDRAPVFQADVPDFFQHQKWGKSTVAQPDPGAEANWEGGTRNYGWCYYAACLNQLYNFKKRGFNTLPGAITDPNTWRATCEAELPKLIDDVKAAVAPDARKVWNDKLNIVLKDRGVGPDKNVKQGLIRVEYSQVGGDVEYISADGTAKKIAGTTLFKVLQTVINNGDLANLRMIRNPGTTALWWSGDPAVNAGYFHAASVGGFDDAGKIIWFADPDSNPDPGSDAGNETDNSGWFDKYQPTGLPDVNPIKKRRFAADAAIPAAGNNPTAAERSRLFFQGTLDANDLTKFKMDAGAFERYDGVQITKLNTLQVLSGQNKPAPPPIGAGAAASSFEVSPGKVGALPVDRIWLFPGESAQQILTPVTIVSGGNEWFSELIAPGSADPWGNIRPNGGVFLWAASVCTQIEDERTLEFSYFTANGSPLESWDLVLDSSAAPSGSAFRVQTFGGGIDQNFDQVAAPTVPSECPGDVDCDGDVDFFDIDPFVAKLGCPGSDPEGCSTGCPWENADVDNDGDVDFFDIDPFVGVLGSICP